MKSRQLEVVDPSKRDRKGIWMFRPTFCTPGWYQLYKASERHAVNYAWAHNAILATAVDEMEQWHCDFDLGLLSMSVYFTFLCFAFKEKKEKRNHIPTTPNTFLISGTKMAISSTTPTMVRVATMWIGQEKGRLPKSSKRAALRACSAHTQTKVTVKTLNHRVHTDSAEKESGVGGWRQWDCCYFVSRCTNRKWPDIYLWGRKK